MDRFIGIATQILQYGWNHPALLIAGAVAAAAAGAVVWHKSKDN